MIRLYSDEDAGILSALAKMRKGKKHKGRAKSQEKGGRSKQGRGNGVEGEASTGAKEGSGGLICVWSNGFFENKSVRSGD